MAQRQVVNFLLGAPALEKIDKIATQADTTRSAVIRMALRIAFGDQDNLIKRLTASKEQF